MDCKIYVPMPVLRLDGGLIARLLKSSFLSGMNMCVTVWLS